MMIHSLGKYLFNPFYAGTLLGSAKDTNVNATEFLLSRACEPPECACGMHLLIKDHRNSF